MDAKRNKLYTVADLKDAMPKRGTLDEFQLEPWISGEAYICQDVLNSTTKYSSTLGHALGWHISCWKLKDYLATDWGQRAIAKTLKDNKQ